MLLSSDTSSSKASNVCLKFASYILLGNAL